MNLYIVFYSIIISGEPTSKTTLEDSWLIFESEQEALERYEAILKSDELYCAGWSKLIGGTDWL